MGKEIVTKQLTPKEWAFARIAAETGNYLVAATDAGYADPEGDSRRVAARPAVQEAIRQEIERLFTGRLVTLAAKALERLLTDPETSATAVVAAAKAAFDRGGFAPQSDKAPTLDAASMSTEQLKSLAGALHGELATRAKNVSGSAPKPDVIDVEVAEILE